jgi:hypothetical protein
MGGGSGSPTGDDPRYTSPARQREIEAEIKANLQGGRNAMSRVLADQCDAVAAMHRADVGPIDFVWDRNGYGIKHILERRGEQDQKRPGANALTPEETAHKLVEVIARGTSRDTGKIIEIDHDGFRAVLARSKKKGHPWLLSGFQRWPETERKSR